MRVMLMIKGDPEPGQGQVGDAAVHWLFAGRGHALASAFP